MTSNMIRKSMAVASQHISPLANGRIDEGYDNIKVRMLFWPDEAMFKNLVYKATMATRGSDIDETEQPDPQVVEEAFKGGLNQVLEVATVSFEISGISRGLTHELVRTRKASFAQQSMRHTDFGDANQRMPAEIANASEVIQAMWVNSVGHSVEAYQWLVDADVPFQDARTVLPISTETYIIASYPLNEFFSTYSYRACHMFYPEIVALFGLMKIALVKQCPWTEPFIQISCEKTRSAGIYDHMCTYQGWEKVEGQCPFAWAKEANRVWKSSKFEG